MISVNSTGWLSPRQIDLTDSLHSHCDDTSPPPYTLHRVAEMLVGEVAPAHLSDITLANMDDSVAAAHLSDVTLATMDSEVAPAHLSDITLATMDDSVPAPHWRERRRLTGHQRRVAAISFLANIPGQGGPGYRCLQGTQVLESYRRSRARRRGAAGRDTTPEQRAASHEKSDSAPSRKMTSARLNTSGCQEVTVGCRKRPSYGSQWSEEVLDTSTTSSRRVRHNSSSESLGPLVPLNMDRERLRKISGTSHGSHVSHGSSVREVTFIKAEDHGKITEERLVFISHSKVTLQPTKLIQERKCCFQYPSVSQRHTTLVPLDAYMGQSHQGVHLDAKYVLQMKLLNKYFNHF